MTFKYHINFLRTKISKWVGILYKLKFILPKEICVKLYKSFIESYIHYGLEVWFSASKNLTNKIFVLQKKAVRAICFLPYNHHTSEIIKSLEDLKLDDCFKLKALTILFKGLKYITYSFLSNFLLTNGSFHYRTTRKSNLLRLFRYNLNKTKKYFLYWNIKDWNDVVSPFNFESNRDLQKSVCNLLFSSY